MGQLIQALNRAYVDEVTHEKITLKTRGFAPKSKEKHNPKKFKLTTVVSAKVDFDEESRDLADEGQHSYGGRTVPSATTHNPHAKLFFPENAIELNDHYSPFGAVEGHQKVTPTFYEFVGAGIHGQADGGVRHPYPYAVFSSGGTNRVPWRPGLNTLLREPIPTKPIAKKIVLNPKKEGPLKKGKKK